MSKWFNGKCLRLMALLAFVVLVLTLGIQEGTSGQEIVVYICDIEGTMRECAGEDDVATCADLGNNIACVESSCGHQFANHIDISVSGAADPLEEGTPTDTKSGFMIFWSFIPYALMIVLLVTFLLVADTTTLSFIFLPGIIAVVNEVLFKQILSQHRPTGSCLYFKSYGMPSGHATTSIGLLWYAILEIWVDRPGLTLGSKAVLTSAVAFFLAPVPYSRVYLHDHFAAQVGVGAAVGFVLASLWFWFMYSFVKSRLDGWIKFACCKWFQIRNTYRNGEPWLPAWMRGESAPEPSTAEEDHDVEQGNVPDADGKATKSYVEMSEGVKDDAKVY